jgi:hypothetical protein
MDNEQQALIGEFIDAAVQDSANAQRLLAAAGVDNDAFTSNPKRRRRIMALSIPGRPVRLYVTRGTRAVRMARARRVAWRLTMPQFMLLLYDNPEASARFRAMSPEEMQKALEKYMAWTKKPFTVDSKRLAGDPGKVIRSANGKARTTDGPFSETKEVLGGFYLIEAADYDDAVVRTNDHPHLEYGGTIEVRKLYGQ